MIFKKINLEYAAFDQDTMPELRNMLIENCEKMRDAGPMADLVAQPAGAQQMAASVTSLSEKAPKGKKKKGGRRD